MRTTMSAAGQKRSRSPSPSASQAAPVVEAVLAPPPSHPLNVEPLIGETLASLVGPSTFAAPPVLPPAASPTTPAHAAAPPPPDPPLSADQAAVLDLVRQGHNVFLTGVAGTGKSFLLKRIVREAVEKYGPDCVGVTASTGIAAYLIRGCTLHGWAGIGLGVDSETMLTAIIKKSPGALSRWQDARLLIIDEISMLSGELLDKLNAVAQNVRKNNKVFGGIPVLLCGDFAQLPPVAGGSWSREDIEAVPGADIGAELAKPTYARNPASFAFEAKCWGALVTHKCMLTTVHRQKEDKQFINLLSSLRLGRVPTNASSILSSGGALVSVGLSQGIKPTYVFPCNSQVDAMNKEELEKLAGDAVTYVAEDAMAKPEYDRYLFTLQDGCPAGKRIDLKIGAVVILLQNIDTSQGLVNGARGVVVDFAGHVAPGVQTGPLGAAIPAPFRIPLSHPTCPIVQFFDSAGQKGREIVIGPALFTLELGEEVMATRTQLPLRLAYAITVHKSQGQTLDRIRVECTGIFENGQLYTALSRAVSLDRLQTLSFKHVHVKAHPKVLAFYAGDFYKPGVNAVGGRPAPPAPAAPPVAQAPPPPGEDSWEDSAQFLSSALMMVGGGV